MPDQSPTTIVGCLLDVSGSMRSALEIGRDNHQPATDRFHAILSAAPNLAQAEQSHESSALMFVGAFGLLEEEAAVVDLCAVVEALVGEEKDEGKSGHDLLIRIANEKGLKHISRYIRTKLMDDEARMVYVHLGLHPEKIQEFVEAIPPLDEVEELQWALEKGENAMELSHKFLTGFPSRTESAASASCCFGKAVRGYIEDKVVDRSEAIQLARRICKEWLQDFGKLKLRKMEKVIKLLQKLQQKDQSKQTAGNNSDSQNMEPNTLLDKLRKHNIENRILVLLSDGVSTDGDPLPIAEELKKENVVIATVYLTSNPATNFQRHLHYNAVSDWNDGQRVLFNMAHQVSCLKHPIPVLATLGWKIPSAGEAALYATVNSAAALDEFCSMLLTARFGSAETVLDILGRIDMDKYVDDENVRNCSNPSDQGNAGVCYAHAAAFVLHSALLRIVGRTNSYPTIEQIRNRILNEFRARDRGWNTEEVLRTAIKWYPPLRFDKVDEDAARQAVLRRRFILSTFHLPQPGWDAFGRHFGGSAASCRDVLSREIMKPYRDLKAAGGHAVALVGCAPQSLTFVNSWGKNWGDGGRFSVEDSHSLTSLYRRDNGMTTRIDACFYDVYWWESGLDSAERAAYQRHVQERLRKRAQMYPEILEAKLQCPSCRTLSPVIEFGGDICRVVCPAEGCRMQFKPEGEQILQALYVRAGVSSAMD
ncbi:hypothetical protein ACJQWK_03073 [Exserohilum turcicum]